MAEAQSRRDIIAYLEKRRSKLIAWLKREDPNCFTEQRHLEEGAGERAYWHYGYLIALQDTLQLLSQKSAKALRT
jgi:hypothetical protein